MRAPERLKLALSQDAEAVDPGSDSALSFTDILFGFVIIAIFTRLQNWGALAGFVRWQLITSTVIVLGSWIGFRQSSNRSKYKLRFFNLPLFRFILDQVMVLLYFRIAVLTPGHPTELDPANLASNTLEVLFFIFVLYLLWDIGNLLMSWKWTRSSSKYVNSTADWRGLAITTVFLICFAALLFVDHQIHVGASQASLLFAIAVALLLAYRWAKDIRRAWKNVNEGIPASSPA
jgi:hypothetical protein